MAQDINSTKKMTVKEAIEILSAASYINYDKEELLEAVNLLRGDITEKDLLDKFYRYYYEEISAEDPNFNDYQTMQDIFAGTEYAEILKKDTEDTAQKVAEQVVKNPDEDYSIAMLDNIQALFRVVPKSEDIDSAAKIINTKVEAKLDDVVAGKESIDVFEIEPARRLVANLEDEDKKAAVEQKLDAIQKDYEEENGLDQDVEVLRKNDATLGGHLSNINLYDEDGNVSDEFSDFAAALANLKITEDDASVLPEDKKRENLTMLFEAAKLEAHKEKIGDIKYLLSSKKVQREQLTEKVKDLFFAKIGQAGVASSFEPATAKEQQDENKFKEYLERRSKAAQKFIANLIQGGQKLSIKVKDIVAAAADTDVEISRFKSTLETKLGKGCSVLGQKLQNFRSKAAALWGKRYDIARSIVQNIKDNKWQHIGNTIATAGMWGMAALGGPAAYAAVAGYAVYSAAGSWIWPVVAEAQKQRAAAKKEGGKLKFWDSIKSAWNTKKNDRNYRVQGAWGIVGGVVGAGLGMGGFSMGVNAVTAKVAAGLARTCSSLSAQTTSWLFAKRDYKKEPSEENRSNLKSARTSFIIGLVVSAVSSYFSLGRLGSGHAEDTVNSVLNDRPQSPAETFDSQHKLLAPGLPKDSADVALTDTAAVADTAHVAAPRVSVETVASTDTTDVKAPQDSPEISSRQDNGNVVIVSGVNETYSFPDTYSEEMGITRTQYKVLKKLYKPEDLDRMYTNLEGEGVMAHFDGMTKEQVLFKYQRLDAWTDMTSKGVSIQGAIRYHYEKEMTSLNKLLNCGDKLTAEEFKAAKGALDVIDSKGKYHGPDGEILTDNVMNKADPAKNCGEGHTNHWENNKKVSVAREHVMTKESDPLSQQLEVSESTVADFYGKSEFTFPDATVAAPTEPATISWETSFVHGRHPIDENATIYISGNATITDANGAEKVLEEIRIDGFKFTEDNKMVFNFVDANGNPLPADSKVTLNGEAMIVYSEESGYAPDKINLKALSAVVTEPEKPAEYQPATAEAVAAAAQKAGAEPDTLFKVDDNTYKMYTADGIININIDEKHDVLYSVTNLDGSEVTEAPKSRLESLNSQYQKAEKVFRDTVNTEKQKTKIPASVLAGRSGGR